MIVLDQRWYFDECGVSTLLLWRLKRVKKTKNWWKRQTESLCRLCSSNEGELGGGWALKMIVLDQRWYFDGCGFSTVLPWWPKRVKKTKKWTFEFASSLQPERRGVGWRLDTQNDRIDKEMCLLGVWPFKVITMATQKGQKDKKSPKKCKFWFTSSMQPEWRGVEAMLDTQNDRLDPYNVPFVGGDLSRSLPWQPKRVKKIYTCLKIVSFYYAAPCIKRENVELIHDPHRS